MRYLLVSLTAITFLAPAVGLSSEWATCGVGSFMTEPRQCPSA